MDIHFDADCYEPQTLDTLADVLSPKVNSAGFMEVILMTYSFVQNAINTDAFSDAAPIFDRAEMTGRSHGKYCYRSEILAQTEAFL